MAKCKNCYHYEACTIYEDYEDDYAAKNACDLFRNKSLVVELPCKVGDTVYILIEESEKFGGSYIKEEKVVEISTAGKIWTDDCFYDSGDIGKMMFFNREAAQRALEESEKNETD